MHAAVEEIQEALGRPPFGQVIVGWDGFQDRIHRVVKQRRTDHVMWMDRIEQLRDLLLPGQSANAEWQLIEQRVGGNAALLASALAPLVKSVQLIATLGSAQAPGNVPSHFESLVQAGIHVHSCGAHAVTDALEFADGKLFLGQMNGLLELSWERLIQRVGQENFKSLWMSSQIACLTNWTMTPHMTSIWRGLAELGKGPGWMLIDLAEPSKRSDSELREALEVLQNMPGKVLLGLNDRESQRVASVLGVPPDSQIDPATRMSLIQQRLGLAACVLHRKDLAIWCGQSQVALALPVIASPKTLTGAGDHFNAGLVLGLLHELSPLASLCLGHAVASSWIQQGREISQSELNRWIVRGRL